MEKSQRIDITTKGARYHNGQLEESIREVIKKRGYAKENSTGNIINKKEYIIINPIIN
ncbi:17324_t:CDS:2, partial [Rhizophagus irregularis]